MSDDIEFDDKDLLPIEDAPDDPVSDKGKSLDDIIDSALGADEAAPAEAGEGRARDEKGRFAPKTSDVAEALQPEPSKAAPPVESTEPKPQTAQPDATSEGQFRGWKPEERDAFGKLPPEAQKVVLDVVKGRDAFYSQRLTELDQAVKATTPMVTAVQPHMPRIRALGATPDQYVAHVLDMDHRLQFAPYQEKLELFTQLAQNIGIPFVPPTPDPFADPMQPGSETYPVIHDLRTKVSTLEAQLNQYRASSEATQQQQTVSLVSSFASETNPDGTPKRPHFDLVRHTMGQLLAAGRANTLEDAYAMAAKPIEDELAKRTAHLAKQAESARLQAIEKAKRVRPVKTSGAMPNGRTSRSGLDAILSESLDRAGIN